MNTENEKSADTLIPIERNTTENEHSENKTFNDLDRGWSWMVLLASFGVFWVLGGNMYALSITQTILLERFNESVSLTSWAGALQSGLISSGGFIVDSGGTYKQAFILGGTAILLATIAAAVVLFLPKQSSEISVQIKDSDMKNTS